MRQHPFPLEVFISYSHKDESVREEFEAHLAPLTRDGMISVWHDRHIPPGDHWRKKIDDRLLSSKIVILMISKDYLASDFCHDVELRIAMEQHHAGISWVVPVIISPVDWHHASFAKLQVLPKDGKAISTWLNRDDAYKSIAMKIREIAIEIGYFENEVKDEISRTDLCGTTSAYQQSAVLTATEAAYIELTIDAEFDTYSEDDKNRLLQAIGHLLGIKGGIRVVRKRRGSVKLTLKLSPLQVEKLLWAVKGGELNSMDVVDAAVVESVQGKQSRRRTVATNVSLLLKEDVDALGKRGDIVRVKPGYARNYLLPNGLATMATEANKRAVVRHTEKLAKLFEQKMHDLQIRADAIGRYSVTIEAKANEEGHLYGSIMGPDISRALKAAGYNVDAENVRLEGPLKELGMYTVKIQLHPEVKTDIKVWIVPSR